MKAQLIAAVAAALCGAARAGLSPDLPAANPWPIRETRWAALNAKSSALNPKKREDFEAIVDW